MSDHVHGADVLVVGAGIAGLVCARDLRRHGVDVVVAEARDRVGGRLLTTALPDGTTVELGGQFLGPGQDRAYALAAELGLRTFRTHTAGRQVLETEDGRVRRYRGTTPRVSPLTLVDVGRAQRRFERLARTVDPAAPWDAPGAADLDAQTLATWIAANLRTDGGRRLFGVACGAVWSAEPAELSLLHALFYARAAGGLGRLVDTDGGAQQDRLDGGAQQLALRLADGLGPRVCLGEPVEEISQDSGGVRVTARTGRTWHTERVVVAVPPPLAARLRYDPPLPADRDALTQRLPMGAVVKVMAVYAEPFWRADGLSGQAVSLRGPIGAAFDSSPDDGGHGVLLGFVEGAAARAHLRLPARARRAAALDALDRLFGPRAGEPVGYVEQDWIGEPFSRGGYAALFPPGAWTQLGPALRRPVGRIHWSGTETATRWYGYIDGAVRAGEQTARDLLS
ncbi:MAG TPA: flavin monoamine oxidase family protein [Mycobacteriales bacterium]